MKHCLIIVLTECSTTLIKNNFKNKIIQNQHDIGWLFETR